MTNVSVLTRDEWKWLIIRTLR